MLVFTLKVRLCLYRITINFLLSPLFDPAYSSTSGQFFCSVLCFPCIMIYILTFAKAIRKMTAKDLKGIIFENYHSRTGFPKENS